MCVAVLFSVHVCLSVVSCSIFGTFHDYVCLLRFFLFVSFVCVLGTLQTMLPLFARLRLYGREGYTERIRDYTKVTF